MRSKPVYVIVGELQSVSVAQPWWTRMMFWRDYRMHVFGITYAWEDAPDQSRKFTIGVVGYRLTPATLQSLFTNAFEVMDFDSDEVNR